MKFSFILSVLCLQFMLSQNIFKDSIIPPDILFKRNVLSEFAMSTDGKFFSVLQENNIGYDLLIIDVDQHALLNRIPVGNNKLNNVVWISNKRLLYESYGLIYAIDRDGTNKKVLVDNLESGKKVKTGYNIFKAFKYNSIKDLMLESKEEILVETYDYEGYSTLKRVNIFTGEKIDVLSGAYHKMNEWMTDLKGKVKLGVREEDGVFNYFIENKVTKKWEPLFINLGEKKHSMSISAKSYLNQPFVFEGFSAEEDVIYLSTNIDSDKRRLISYSISKNQLEKIIHEDKNCDITDPHGTNARMIMNPVTKELVGIGYESVTPTQVWFDTYYQEASSKLNSLEPSFFNEVLMVSNDGKRFLVYQKSDDRPGRISVYDINKESLSVIIELNEELDKFKLTKSKVIIVNTPDNYKLQAYLNLPNNYGQDSVPMVVIPHGGPWARDYWELDRFAQYYSSRGYATLRVNFRGSSGMGKQHLLSGVSNIDKIMIDDLANATDFVLSKYKINTKKVFIYGHSYGGYATYMSIIKYPNKFAAGVAVSAPTDIKLWMKQNKKEKNIFAYEFWQTALGNNNSAEYLNRISPISYSNTILKPMMVFHGKLDQIIPVEQAENMREKLKLNPSIIFKVLEKEGHSMEDTNSIGYILDTSFDFFQTKSN